MATETRTDVALKWRVEGIGQVNSAIQGVGQRGTEAMARVERETKNLDETFKKLTDQQLELSRVMGEIEDTASPAYRKLAKDMNAVQKEAAQVERTLKNVQRAYRETDTTAAQAANRRKQEQQEQRRGAFSQGLMQGLIPEAAYLQRGPGMMRQAAGAAIGGRMRGVAGGMANMPFSGAAGLAQVLQSVPGGGFLAMPLQQSMQYAQQALQFQQQRQQMAPFLQMGQETGATITTGETAAAQRRRAMATAAQRMAQAKAPLPEVRPWQGGSGGIGEGPSLLGAASSLLGGVFGGGPKGLLERGRAQRERQRGIASAGGAPEYEAQLRQAEQKRIAEGIIREEGVRRQEKRSETLQDVLRRQGAGMGFALPEAMQMAGQITQAGGGVGRELVSQGLGGAGMAAQRLYGIGGDVTGAFLQAGRRGGAVGARGRGGEAMVEAIVGGMRMGLEGSELTTYMQQMAGDIRNWQQTGININTSSLSALGVGIGQRGLGGVRGGVVARGLATRGRALAQRGPQSAAELIMLQEMGGYQPGVGGVEAFEEAQLRLEGGDFKKGGFGRMVSRLSQAGGGGGAGRQILRSSLKGLGVDISIPEARRLQAGEVSPAEMAQMEEVAKRGPTTVEGMVETAGAGVAPALKRQAVQTNQQLLVGGRMITIMQDLEKSTRNVAEGFTVLAKAPLKELTSGLTELTGEIPKLSKRLKAFMGGDVANFVMPVGEVQ